jgi:hypothetical protein
MTSDCKVWFTDEDVFQFACGGASETVAKQKLSAMVRTDFVPKVFHCGYWKSVTGPFEGYSLPVV